MNTSRRVPLIPMPENQYHHQNPERIKKKRKNGEKKRPKAGPCGSNSRSLFAFPRNSTTVWHREIKQCNYNNPSNVDLLTPCLLWLLGAPRPFRLRNGMLSLQQGLTVVPAQAALLLQSPFPHRSRILSHALLLTLPQCSCSPPNPHTSSWIRSRRASSAFPVSVHGFCRLKPLPYSSSCYSVKTERLRPVWESMSPKTPAHGHTRHKHARTQRHTYPPLQKKGGSQ